MVSLSNIATELPATWTARRVLELETEQTVEHRVTSPNAINSLLGQMIEWENGELSEEDTIDLFQRLLNSGIVWELQGMYGRYAMGLMDQGLIADRFA